MHKDGNNTVAVVDHCGKMVGIKVIMGWVGKSQCAVKEGGREISL